MHAEDQQFNYLCFWQKNWPVASIINLGNCDIDFFNFRHWKVRNFKISNLFQRSQNFAVIFLKYLKQNWKSTKYFEISQKPRVIPLKFHEMLLVSWNLVNYCKIMPFLIRFCKSLKDFINIFLKLRGKTVKYCLNIINFRSCTEKWPKVGQRSSITLTKVHVIPWRFSRSWTFGFNEILSRFVSFRTKIFHFTRIL